MNHTEEFLRSRLQRAQELASAQGEFRRVLSRRRRRSLSVGSSEDFPVDFVDSDEVAPEEALDGELPTNLSSGDFDAGGVEDDPLIAQQKLHRTRRDIWKRQPGMGATRVMYRRVKSLGDSMNAMIKRNNWDNDLKVGTLLGRWDALVGANVAQHSQVESFEDGTLTIRCTSTAWAKQLQLLLPTIEKRLAQEIGPGLIKKILIRGPVTRSWKKGPLSVPGRGPRDTYG